MRDRSIGQGVRIVSTYAPVLHHVGTVLLDDLETLSATHRLDDRRRPVSRSSAVEDRLARLCYAAAWFEEAFRAGRVWSITPLGSAHPAFTLDELLDVVPAYAAADITAVTGRAVLAGAVVREKLCTAAGRGRAYDVAAHHQAAMLEQLLAHQEGTGPDRPEPGKEPRSPTDLTAVRALKKSRTDVEALGFTDEQLRRLQEASTGARSLASGQLSRQTVRTTGRVTALDLQTPEGPVRVASFGYDTAGGLVEVSGARGVPLWFTYDDEHRVTSWTDRNGHTYGYVYDPAGRVVETVGPGGALSSRFAYDTAARETRFTDSTGALTVTCLNTLGQTVSETDLPAWYRGDRLFPRELLDDFGEAELDGFTLSEAVSRVPGRSGPTPCSRPPGPPRQAPAAALTDQAAARRAAR
ncbi:RHS repeat domain-containing protein [Streptomyces niveus]|uniref:RHS repeat domain-containing protein n=1 Tax=Streptomyces niveus TaxID=193462 RepID=UPI0036DE434B